MQNESDIISTANKNHSNNSNNSNNRVANIPPSLDDHHTTTTMKKDTHLKPWDQTLEETFHQMKLKNHATNRKNKSNHPINHDNSNIQIWWFDAYEKINRGHVYLFGKIFNQSTNQYESCCIIIKNIMQTIFVLPRPYKLLDGIENSQLEPVSMDEVINEFTNILNRHKILNWKSSIVKRKYAFDKKDIPKESTYLKIQYSYENPQLPQDMNGLTFSHVFGTNTNPLEHLIVKRKMMGPCWLTINEPIKSYAKESWCRHEYIIMNPKNIHAMNDDHQHLETPPLTIMALQLHTTLNTEKITNEILVASALICPEVYIDHDNELENQDSVNITVVRKWDHQLTFPKDLNEHIIKEKEKGFNIIIQHTEYALLNYLCGKIHIYDPDIIVGHDFSSYTLDILLHRMKELDIPFWNKLGRLRWKSFPKLQSGPGGTDLSTSKEKMVLVGRLLCDTYTATKDLIQSKSYHLTHLAKTQLGIERQEMTFEKKHFFFNLSSSSIINMAKHCWMDAYFSMAILFKIQILPLTKMLTNISGNLWSRSLNGARANRNEFLLLHEFHRLKYIYPDKKVFDYQDIELFEMEEETLNGNDQIFKKSPTTLSTNLNKKKRLYGGGLVLEPKSGFYDKYVVLLDFNSLYPSIIQEFNICFTTVDRNVGDHESEVDVMPSYPDSSVPKGILPRLVMRFVDERKQYDIKQKALKLTANSIYGCLGFSQSRFAARQLAMMITSKGRYILQDSVHVAEELGLNVIYGDTDSIMIATDQTDLEKVYAIGKLLQEKVNLRYQLLELDIDGIFKRLLILTKKKYAALTVECINNIWVESIESKGLDLVRKDWCEISREVSMNILEIILSDAGNKETTVLTILKDACNDIRNGKIPSSKFIIYKQLTKSLDDYSRSDSFPHVQVAKRLQKAGKIIKQGDTVEYIICIIQNEKYASVAEKACYPEQIENGEFIIDTEWYIKQQILPPIIRLCERIMNTTHFEEHIGLKKQRKNSEQKKKGLNTHQQDYHQNNNTNNNNQSEKSAVAINDDSDEDENNVYLKSTINNTSVVVEELIIRCQHCGKSSIFHDFARCMNDDKWICILQCPLCLKMMSTASVSAQVILSIRNFIKRYYQGWLSCDNETDCGYKTNDHSMHCNNPIKCNGVLKREYSEDMLYEQLIYFRNIFDTKKNTSTNIEPHKQAIADQYHHAFKLLYETVQKYVDQCGYRYINLNNLFTNGQDI
ncbi:unnamed protein product [Cunninghamella blakesleeana]